MKGDDKHLVVNAIENGTVIDHIPSTSLFAVISILQLEKLNSQMTFGVNLESKKLGSKAIIKVAGKYFENSELNKIALVAPQAKLNIIRNYQVVEKRVVEIPEDEISGIIKCPNPVCITNHEKITTKFHVLSRSDMTVRCNYCEKVINRTQIEIL
ncbi:MAG: aspartate carbamoyltransferase regulatory subunit [Bacteroidales bacterium]|nr:aspartate carbamoyltransferase regulatory subunit [Bacteroidales bacterium]